MSDKSAEQIARERWRDAYVYGNVDGRRNCCYRTGYRNTEVVIIGWGKTDAEAWADAARRVEER